MLFETLLMQALAGGVPPTQPTACAPDAKLVRGQHHEQVQRLCIDKRHGKCWGFFPGLVMLEPRVTPVAVCMDRYEWPNRTGERPRVMMRFLEAEASCRAVGKRLCSEFEWELACEGPLHQPWPYGWKQQRGSCNSEKPYRPIHEAKLSSGKRPIRQAEASRLWQGAASGSHPGCDSPFGVSDLIGNVEEWVTTSRPEWPYRSSLKGGFWSKPWTGCRGTNERHGPQFRFYEIGFRCCSDPRTPGP